MNTIKKYCSLTNNRITIAYLLLNKINDSSSQAQELASMLRNINCMVNLLKYNNIKEGKRLSASTNSAAFKKVLLDNNILFTERTSTGTKINAACGQLRAKHGEK
jgi:23S rRNA (adenine2503-C2)-methyltransferase